MDNKVHIVLFGCKDTTLYTARFLANLNISIDLITISSETAKKNEVAGYLDLQDFSALFNSIYVAESYSLNNKDRDAILRLSPQAAFCIGWQRLIPEAILAGFKFGVFGMHGSARDLPFGKGRSPMNWALLEGRQHFKTNLFRYLPGIDNGPILGSNTFSIGADDTAESLHYKNTIAMCTLISENLTDIITGQHHEQTQRSDIGESFYPKRNPKDGAIDWRDDIHNIIRLIRAVTRPFSGAYSSISDDYVFIFRAGIFYTDLENHPFKKNEFGEILSVFPNSKFLVRCSGGVIITHEYEGITPVSGMAFDIMDSPFKHFSRNVYGFFDI